jgi:hypothetical protein
MASLYQKDPLNVQSLSPNPFKQRALCGIFIGSLNLKPVGSFISRHHWAIIILLSQVTLYLTKLLNPHSLRHHAVDRD